MSTRINELLVRSSIHICPLRISESPMKPSLNRIDIPSCLHLWQLLAIDEYLHLELQTYAETILRMAFLSAAGSPSDRNRRTNRLPLWPRCSIKLSAGLAIWPTCRAPSPRTSRATSEQRKPTLSSTPCMRLCPKSRLALVK